MTEFALIDERGRAAGAGLRAAASFRPDPATSPTPSPSRTPRGMVWAAAVALVAVIAGVVYLTGRDNPPADEPAPTSLRYVLGDLPDGWSVTSAKDVGVATAPDNEADVQFVLYGTSGDPTAPTVILSWDGNIPVFGVADFQALGGEYREFEADGRAGTCGEVPPVRYVLCAIPPVDASGLGTVVVRAGGMTLDQIVDTVKGLTLDGEPALPIDALPAGAVLLDRSVGNASLAVALGTPDSAAVTSVEYRTDDGEVGFLVTGDGATQQLSAAAAVATWRKVTRDGATYFVMDAIAGGNPVVTWSTGGRAFQLGVPVSEDELLDLAASVRPASDEEWAGFTPRTGVGTGGTLPATIDTQAPPTSIAVDPTFEVEVGMTVEPLAGGSAKVSSTGEGTSTEVFTLRLTETTFLFAGGGFSASGGLNPTQPLINPINTIPGVWAVIPGGGTLVVNTADGGRYTARTVQPIEGVAVDFAMVALTVDVVSAEVLDGAGNVIDRWTPEG